MQLRLLSFALIELICSTIFSSTPGDVSLCLAMCPGPYLSPVASGVYQHRAAVSWISPKDEISSLFVSVQRDCWALGADTGYVQQGEEEPLCFSVIWAKVLEQLCKWKGEQGYSSFTSPGGPAH